MPLRVSFLKHAGVGFPLGVVLGNLIAWMSGGIVSPAFDARTGSQTGAIIIQTLAAGLYGAAGVGGMILYKIERWPLVKATVVHYLIVAVLYIPAALLLGWAESAADLLIVEGIQLAAFLLIWGVMVLRYRAEVKKLNNLVKKRASVQ